MNSTDFFLSLFGLKWNPEISGHQPDCWPASGCLSSPENESFHQVYIYISIIQILPWETSVPAQPAWMSPVLSLRGWVPWQWCPGSPAPGRSSPAPSGTSCRHPGPCDCSAGPPPAGCTASPSLPSANRSSAAAGRPSWPPGTPAWSSRGSGGAWICKPRCLSLARSPF